MGSTAILRTANARPVAVAAPRRLARVRPRAPANATTAGVELTATALLVRVKASAAAHTVHAIPTLASASAAMAGQGRTAKILLLVGSLRWVSGLIQAFADPCASVSCGSHGRCDPTTGMCVCNMDWSGDQCQYSPDSCKLLSVDFANAARAGPWLGLWDADNACSRFTCCCLSGRIVVTAQFSAMDMALLGPLAGECGGQTQVQFTVPLTAELQFTTTILGQSYR